MFYKRKNLNDVLNVFADMFSQFDSSNGKWKTQTKISDDGNYWVTSYFYGNEDKKENNNLDSQLRTAIENEDFEMAVKLRDQIKKLESHGKEIQRLESELKKSIHEQNFEKSIELRDQLKKLK